MSKESNTKPRNLTGRSIRGAVFAQLRRRRRLLARTRLGLDFLSIALGSFGGYFRLRHPGVVMDCQNSVLKVEEQIMSGGGRIRDCFIRVRCDVKGGLGQLFELETLAVTRGPAVTSPANHQLRDRAVGRCVELTRSCWSTYLSAGFGLSVPYCCCDTVRSVEIVDPPTLSQL
jgi:hypothetical protein